MDKKFFTELKIKNLKIGKAIADRINFIFNKKKSIIANQKIFKTEYNRYLKIVKEIAEIKNISNSQYGKIKNIIYRQDKTIKNYFKKNYPKIDIINKSKTDLKLKLIKLILRDAPKYIEIDENINNDEFKQELEHKEDIIKPILPPKPKKRTKPQLPIKDPQIELNESVIHKNYILTQKIKKLSLLFNDNYNLPTIKYLNDNDGINYNPLKHSQQEKILDLKFKNLIDRIYNFCLMFNDYESIDLSLNFQTSQNKFLSYPSRGNGNLNIRFIPDNLREKEILDLIKSEGNDIKIFDGIYTINNISKILIENFITQHYSSIVFSYNNLDIIYTGFNILFHDLKNKDEESEEKIIRENLLIKLNDIRAFEPILKNPDYHKATQTSTTKNRICIYETYHYLYKNPENLKNNINIIKNDLENEDSDIIKLVKEGKLLDFIKLKSIEHNEKFYIDFFKSKNNPISILGDDIKEITKKDLLNKKVFLYADNHTAAGKPLNNNDYEKEHNKKLNIVKKSNFILKPQLIKERRANLKIKQEIILGYDTETRLDKDNKALIYCLCIGDNNYMKSFYNSDDKLLIKDFIEYIDKKFLIKTGISKTRPTEPTKIYNIYGFNNSRFDNILLYLQLHTHATRIKEIITENNIKYIEYFNIRFYDINLYYQGSLSEVSKSFKIDDIKGSYPIKFTNKDNLDYIGVIPDVKYFRSEDDYNKCKLELNGCEFNNKNECIKYCSNDALLTYKIAIKHLENSKGKINNKLFNVSSAITGAGASLKMYNQVFQEDTLYSSPDYIQKIEREAYKGGRTELFKKSFNYEFDDKTNIYKDNITNKLLYAYDINSSYPFVMTQKMPLKYSYTKTNINIKVDINNIDRIISTNLYTYKSVYKGDKQDTIINNLLIRSDKNDIIAPLNIDIINTAWGVELIENVKIGYEVLLYSEYVYESKAIFKSYAEYFYNKRLLAKKEKNNSLSTFYKLMLNSLYGKFGQKQNTKIIICKNDYDLEQIINNKNYKLYGFTDIDKNSYKIEYEEIDDELKSIGTLVRFSSYIASYARTRLSEFMRYIGFENIYYCDTDSIYTDKLINDEKYINNELLGYWKVEKIIKQAIFLNPKSYMTIETDDTITMRGKGNPQNNLIKENYIDNDNNNLIENKNFFIRSLDNIRIISQIRTLKPIYNKRIFSDNTSKPFNNYLEWYNTKY